MNSSFEVSNSDIKDGANFAEGLHMDDDSTEYAAGQDSIGLGFEEECNVCSERFFSLPLFREHMLTHTLHGIECQICYARFQQGDELTQHIHKKHIISGCDNNENHWQSDLHEYPLKCDECNISKFESWYDFHSHLHTHVKLPNVRLERLSKKDIRKFSGKKTRKHRGLKLTISFNESGDAKIAKPKSGPRSRRARNVLGTNGEGSDGSECKSPDSECADGVETPETDAKDMNLDEPKDPLESSVSESDQVENMVSGVETPPAPAVDINEAIDTLSIPSKSTPLAMVSNDTEFISLDSLAESGIISSPHSASNGSVGATNTEGVDGNSSTAVVNSESGESSRPSPEQVSPAQETSVVETSGTSSPSVPTPPITTPATEHKCQMCGAAFETNLELHKHFSSVHLRCGTQQWSCNTCRRQFDSAETLSNHLRSEHNSTLPVSNMTSQPNTMMVAAASACMSQQGPQMQMHQTGPPPPQQQQMMYRPQSRLPPPPYPQYNPAPRPPQVPMQMGQQMMRPGSRLPPLHRAPNPPMPGMVRIPRQAMNIGMNTQGMMPMGMRPPQPHPVQYPNQPMMGMQSMHPPSRQPYPQGHPGGQMFQHQMRGVPPNSILAQSLQRPTVPLGGVPRSLPNLISVSQGSPNSGTTAGVKRPSPVQGRPGQPKQRAVEMGIPNRQSDAECEIIAVQKRSEGLPVIHHVEGATSATSSPTPGQTARPTATSTATSESTIHLTDSITLSVCSTTERDAQQRPQQNPDANAVASLLATRGITVTPAASKEGAPAQPSRQVQPAPRAPPPANPTPTATLNLNSSISIIPTAPGGSGQGGQTSGPGRPVGGFAVPVAPSRANSAANPDRPPRPPTVDLTGDVAAEGLAGLHPAAQQRRQHMQQNRGMHPTQEAHQCQFCDKRFATIDSLQQHMLLHQTSNAAAASRLPYKCNLCNAAYPTPQALLIHRQQYHNEAPSIPPGGVSDLAIPIVDLKQPGVGQQLAKIGVYSCIPLNSLQNMGGGCYGMPLVGFDNARNLAGANLRTMGAVGVLPLGQVKMITRQHM